MKFIDAIYHFFDKVEDNVRGALSRHAFIYTFIGGTGLVLFWRGVWHTADVLQMLGGWWAIIFSPLGSALVGMFILLITGLFVSIFIGDSIIISGIKKDKKVIEKTEDEVMEEKTDIEKVISLIVDLKKEIEVLETKVKRKK